jgi:hypothetical protein
MGVVLSGLWREGHILEAQPVELACNFLSMYA